MFSPLASYPDSAQADGRTIRRTYLRRLTGHFAGGLFRQWWVVWVGLLHGLYLLFGSLWGIVHPRSFKLALPSAMPAWAADFMALGLAFFALWLLAGSIRARVSRATRYAAISISSTLALVCWGFALISPGEGLYLLAGAGHVFFVLGWVVLLVLPRARRRRTCAY